MARPTSIYRSLLRDWILLIVLACGTIMLATYLGARRKLRMLSEQLITQTMLHAESELLEFFDPVTRELQIVRRQGETGQLDIEQSQQLHSLFVPLLQRYRRISSLMIADQTGREYMLMHIDKRWLHRQSYGDQSNEWSLPVQWTDDDPTLRQLTRVDYDPRRRPWFIGAAESRRNPQSPPDAAEPNAEIHWTQPYTFFTTGELGITASTVFTNPDGVEQVIGLDVLLSDISRFTTSVRIAEHGLIVVLDDQARVIGLPRDARYLTSEQRREALKELKRPKDLGFPLFADAAVAFQTQFDPDQQDQSPAVRFASEGEMWWGQTRAVHLSPHRKLWVAAAVPETELLYSANEIRVWIVLIALGCLATAVTRAVVVARRYSQPIEQLVHQSDRLRQGDFEPGAPINAQTVEIKKLADAQDRMRVGLQSLMKLERDLQLAQQIQQSTFPDELPRINGFAIDAWIQPAEQTGGDTYDVVGYRPGANGRPVELTATDARRAIFLLADATGHGIGPALSVAQIRAMLRMAVRTGVDLATVVQHVNEQLCADLPENRFITAWLAELNSDDMTLSFFSGGQAPLLHYHASDGRTDVLDADAPPMGVIPQLDIIMRPPLRLEPGDLFVVASDGIYESMSPQREQFATRRVIEVLNRHHHRQPADIISALRDAIEQFTHGAAADDDRTVVIIQRTG